VNVSTNVKIDSDYPPSRLQAQDSFHNPARFIFKLLPQLVAVPYECRIS